MGRNLTNKAIQDTYEGLVQISGSLLTDGTGSLIDNLDVSASFATTSTSASHADNSDTATSASFATTSTSASFATTATSASHADNSDTATSASFATTASFAVSSSADDLTLQDITDNGATTTNNITINGRLYSGDSITTAQASRTYTIIGGTTNSTLQLQGNDSVPTNSIKLNPTTGIQLSGSVASQNDITAPTFIGDLQGNADTATSASHAVNSDTAISASYATTASLAQALEGGVSLQSVLDTGNEANADMVLTGSLTLGDGGGNNAINITNRGQSNTPTNDGNSLGNIVIGSSNTSGKGASIVLGRGISQVNYSNGQDNASIGWNHTWGAGNQTSYNVMIGRSMTLQGDGNYRGIFAGQSNISRGGANGVILGGKSNDNAGESSAIVAGTGNDNNQLRAVILGGENNTINGGQGGVIAGGINNVVSHNRSVILGGSALSTTKDDEVVAKSLRVISDITASFASFESASIGYLQSITGSAKIIGDAYIILNNNTPTERYAGIVVQDSGSTNNTASLEFDGQTNDWFYEYTDDGGATTEHGVALFGAEYSTKGSPVYPANNVLQKGDGGHHLQDSNITDDGSLITLDSKTKVVGADGEDDILVVQGTDSGGGAIIIAEFDSDAGSGMANTFRFIDSSTNGALFRMEADRGTAKIDATDTSLEIEAQGDILLESVGGNITLDANAGAGQNDISGSTNVVLPTTSDRFKVINDNEKLGVVIRGGVMAGSDETLSTDLGFNNHLFGERITAGVNGVQTCGALAAREVDFGGNQVEYGAFVATQDGTFDGATRSIIAGGQSNTIDTEDSLPSNNAIVGSANSRLGAGETNAIVGGDNNEIVEGNSKAIIGGKNNTLGYDSGVAEYSGSVIVGGFNNLSKYNNTIILGGLSITASAHDTTYTENLDVNGTLSIPGFPDVSASLASSGGGDAFPYTGSAEITGSIDVVGWAKFGASNVSTYANDSNFVAGSNNQITSTGASNTILGGSTMTITNGSSNTIIGGDGQRISSTGARNAIFNGWGGATNGITGGTNNTIVGGVNNNIASTSQSNIIAGGRGNDINAGERAGIFAGLDNEVNHNRSVILGGSNLSTSKADEVVVPNLTTNGAVVQNVEALTISANVAEIDASLGNLFTLTLQNGANTELQITNQSAGQTFQLQITNNATSPGTITFDSQFDFEGGTAFTATATAGAIDILTFVCFGGGNVQCVGAKNFS